MSSYRFCRTDDIGLLVDALNRCWAPHHPDDAVIDAVAFKRSIRDVQVWCSSCMVAFAGGNPIGVLIGAKRASGTLIHRIAVHPDHLRQGHGRHLLTSLSSKLAILGPPRIVAEVPEGNAAARGLFGASGYDDEALLTDYVLEAEVACQERAPSGASRMVIPVTVDDLAANGLLAEPLPPACWERSVETLAAKKNDIDGLAVVTDERIEAYLLCTRDETGLEIVALRSLINSGRGHVAQLLAQLQAPGMGSLRFSKVHPAEFSNEALESLGFHAVATHRLYATRARAN